MDAGVDSAQKCTYRRALSRQMCRVDTISWLPGRLASTALGTPTHCGTLISGWPS